MGTDSALSDAYERDEATPIHAKAIWALSLKSKVTSSPLKCALRDVAVVCWAASGCNKEVKLKTIITRMDEAKSELDKLVGTPEGCKVNMPSCVTDILIPILGDAEEPDANVKKSDITSTTALTDNDFNVRKVQGDAEAQVPAFRFWGVARKHWIFGMLQPDFQPAFCPERSCDLGGFFRH